MKALYAAILTVAFTLLVGCSPPTPSASDAESVLKQQIAEEAAGRIKLVSFKKTDGQAGEMFGVSFYKLSYQAEIEFSEDCMWGEFLFDGSWMGSFVTVGAKEPIWFNASKRKARKGEKITLNGSVGFQKSEKGWKPANL